MSLTTSSKRRADRGQRRLEVLERLHRLGPEVAGDVAVGLQAELARDIDDPAGAGDLDHMGVAAGLGDGRRDS